MVRIIETFSSRQQDSNSHLVIHLPPWCRQPYLIYTVWSELYKNKECKSRTFERHWEIKWWAQVLRNYYPLSGHSFNNLSAPQPITTQQLNCYEINSHVKNVFESFETLQAVWSVQAACRVLQRSRVTDLFLFGKKQGSIFGIIVLQPGLWA